MIPYHDGLLMGAQSARDAKLLSQMAFRPARSLWTGGDLRHLSLAACLLLHPI